MFDDYLDFFSRLGVERWWNRMPPAEASGEVSATGEYYFSSLRVTGVDGEFGGFFVPLDQENYTGFTDALFEAFGVASGNQGGGNWLSEYLEKGTMPELPEQQAFVASFDRLMTGFLDISAGHEAGELYALSFMDFSKDSNVTDTEFAAFLRAYGFEEEIAQMGDYGMPFILFAGGVMQGVVDNNLPTGALAGPGGKYTLEELEVFYSPEAENQVHQLAANHPFLSQIDKDEINRSLRPYILEMENICGSPSRRDIFTPDATVGLRDHSR